ncbi:MAG TPA: hypothetical protein VM487_17390 [Phycisphaerae bacterium]|nr:hypothetical protein [Phycisphaerae bacterium]
MPPEGDERQAKASRARAIIQQKGGIEALVTQVDSESTGTALELLVWNEVQDRAPSPSDESGCDVDTAFVRRVCSKLRFELRHLSDLDLSIPQKEESLLRAVHSSCRRTRSERDGRYLARVPAAIDPGHLDKMPGHGQASGPGDSSSLSQWWHDVRATVLSQREQLAPLLALYERDPDAISALCDGAGQFDVGRISRKFGWSRRETRRLLSYLRREINKVKPMVPRMFRDVCRRLSKLAATSFEGLADAELRRELFDLSRSLAQSFGPENVDVRAVKKLDLSDLNVTLDLLLDEWTVFDLPEQRSTFEHLMQNIVRVCEALEAGDVNRAFVHSAPLILNAARIQHHMSPSRLQVLQAYTYLLRLAGWYDACNEANRAVIERCNAIARQKGAEALDRPPEFDSGETLGRIRTYASSNILVCMFNYQLTTAPQERFAVKDYDALVGLVDRFGELLADDPDADFLWNELLVLCAHIARAAYNLHRTAKGAAKARWKAERDRRRHELREMIDERFFTSEVPKLNARQLVEATLNAAEDCAVERTLDILEEVLHDRPQLVREIRAERLATLQPPGLGA